MSSHVALDRLEETYDLMVVATLSDRVPDAKEILALRQRWTTQMNDLLLALRAELGHEKNRLLLAELEDRLHTLRIRLMSYTMAWQPRQIEEEPEAYRRAAGDMAMRVRNVITEVRGAIDHARQGGT